MDFCDSEHTKMYSCNICGKVMPTTNGSTTGIKQHLARNHEIIDPNYVPKLKTELPKFP